MELVGLCDICSKASRTLNTCWKCGARVCLTCFDPESGLCIKCWPRGKKWMPKNIYQK